MVIRFGLVLPPLIQFYLSLSKQFKFVQCSHIKRQDVKNQKIFNVAHTEQIDHFGIFGWFAPSLFT